MCKLRERIKQSKNIAAFLSLQDASGVFFIRGSPGTCKTSILAMITRDLIAQHNSMVAVSSNSYAATYNLFRSVVGRELR